MKLKSKLITKLTALATSLALSLTVLPTTAMALKDDGSAGVTSNAIAAALYGYNNDNNVSWRIDAYVSTNPTGKIDRDNDSIGTNALQWVGAVIYDNFLTGGRSVYLSTDKTNELRIGGFNASGYTTLTDKDGYVSSTQWALPNVTKVTKDYGYYNLTDGSPIAHITGNPLGLPTNIEKITDRNSYQKLVSKVIKDNDNLTKILEHISTSLGGTADKNIYNKVGKLVSEQVIAKLTAAQEQKGSDAIKLLLPNSQDETTKEDNCIVEWCLVLTPVMGWSTMQGYDNYTFWETYIDGELTFVGDTAGKTNVIVGLDAYSTAQYNKTTQVMYNQTNSASTLAAIGEAGFAVRIQEENGVYLACQKWDKNYFYKAYGKLYAEVMNGLGFVYQAAYNTFSENKWCGIYSANNFLAQTEGLSRKYFVANTSDFAKYGGIGVFVSKFTDPGIPVYYYVYDPAHPDADPEVITSSYTPKDGTTTFTPSTDTGLPANCTVVAMEFAYI